MAGIVLRTNAGVGSDVLIADAGIVVPSAGGSVALPGTNEVERIAASENAATLLTDNAFGVGSSTLELEINGSTILQFHTLALLAGVLARPYTEPVELPWTFATPSPLLVTVIYPGDSIFRSIVEVEVALDGPAPDLDLGSIGSPTAIFRPDTLFPKFADEYQSLERLADGTPVGVILTIDPDGSTIGSGRVIVLVRRS